MVGGAPRGPLRASFTAVDLQLRDADALVVHAEAGERRLVAVGRVGRVVVLVTLVRRPARALVRQNADPDVRRLGLRHVERPHDQLRRARPRHARREASAALVKIRVNCASCEQSTAPVASHAQISNDRSAVKRFWPPGSSASPTFTRSIALTWTRRTWCDACEGIEPDRDLLAAHRAR